MLSIEGEPPPILEPQADFSKQSPAPFLIAKVDAEKPPYDKQDIYLLHARGRLAPPFVNYCCSAAT